MNINNAKLTLAEIKTLGIIILIVICGTLGIDIHLASMPHIMVFMHTDTAHMQQSASIFLLGLVSSSIIASLSDSIHGINILAWSYVTFGTLGLFAFFSLLKKGGIYLEILVSLYGPHFAKV
jgi:hypothetical protein